MRTFQIALIALGAVAFVTADTINDGNTDYPCGTDTTDQWWGAIGPSRNAYCCETCQGAHFNTQFCGSIHDTDKICLNYRPLPLNCAGGAPSCPSDDYTFNCQAENKCQECSYSVPATPDCPSGYTFNQETKECETEQNPCAYLTGDWVFKDGQCVQTKDACPTGFTLYGDHCIKSENPEWVCDAGFEGPEECLCFKYAEATCPEGSTRDGCDCTATSCPCTACPADKPCQHDQAVNGDCSCVTKMTLFGKQVCPPGTTDIATISGDEKRCYFCLGGFD